MNEEMQRLLDKPFGVWLKTVLAKYKKDKTPCNCYSFQFEVENEGLEIEVDFSINEKKERLND